MGRLPNFWMRGIQSRFPVPWANAEVVKRNATWEMVEARDAVVEGLKSRAIWRRATEGPAARKVVRNIPK